MRVGWDGRREMSMYVRAVYMCVWCVCACGVCVCVCVWGGGRVCGVVCEVRTYVRTRK